MRWADGSRTVAWLRGSSMTARTSRVDRLPDSWAVLAWLDGEQPAMDRLEQVLRDRPLMSWVNVVEVYYRVERDHGRGEATRASRECANPSRSIYPEHHS